MLGVEKDLETNSMREDIGPILTGWPYEPGEVTVRKIIGRDGRPRVQLRLDLGLLQMEMTGRPDGQRPFGAESVLDYHLARLNEHKRRRGTDAGFRLSPDECAELRDESIQYYHRYLSLYHLEDFEQVAADTARNLKCLDFMRSYAAEESDRLGSQHYSPYMLMMHTRALAALALKGEAFEGALEEIRHGIASIEAFFTDLGEPELVERSVEIASLKRLAREIRRRKPADPIEQLREELEAAVSAEDYERAATLRDQLRSMEANS